jgi:hypothetical protein
MSQIELFPIIQLPTVVTTLPTVTKRPDKPNSRPRRKIDERLD